MAKIGTPYHRGFDELDAILQKMIDERGNITSWEVKQNGSWSNSEETTYTITINLANVK